MHPVSIPQRRLQVITMSRDSRRPIDIASKILSPDRAIRKAATVMSTALAWRVSSASVVFSCSDSASRKNQQPPKANAVSRNITAAAGASDSRVTKLESTPVASVTAPAVTGAKSLL